MQPAPAPAHLSPSAQQWWQTTVEAYVLEEHHLRLLQLCCEAWDRAQAARAQLDREGLTVLGREGGIRPHPCIAVERDSRLAVAAWSASLTSTLSRRRRSATGRRRFSPIEAAMPVKLRVAKERRPSFSPEVVALFIELEAVPARQRSRPEWQVGSKRLAGLLGLTSEWWATCHVHDRSARPCWPDGYYAHAAWHRCRVVQVRYPAS